MTFIDNVVKSYRFNEWNRSADFISIKLDVIGNSGTLRGSLWGLFVNTFKDPLCRVYIDSSTSRTQFLGVYYVEKGRWGRR